MIKVEKFKNAEGVLYSTIDIGNLRKVSWEMYQTNEDKFYSGNHYGQCTQCGKGIKERKNSYQTICDYNNDTIVKISDYEIAKSSPGMMDCFEIGPECARRIKKACKDSGIKWQDYITKMYDD